MRYKPEQKIETHKRIVNAAERSFKKAGYSGIGVDGLAKEAGVTSGAFYGHFKSKQAAFMAAISSGMAELMTAIEEFQQTHGENWWSEFAEFYTSQKRNCDLAESCALQSLSSEVTRSTEAVRELFETELLKILTLANGDSSQQEMNKSWASLAMLIGGVTLSRAVVDEKVSEDIANAIKQEVVAMHKPE